MFDPKGWQVKPVERKLKEKSFASIPMQNLCFNLETLYIQRLVLKCLNSKIHKGKNAVKTDSEMSRIPLFKIFKIEIVDIFSGERLFD